MVNYVEADFFYTKCFSTSANNLTIKKYYTKILKIKSAINLKFNLP